MKKQTLKSQEGDKKRTLEKLKADSKEIKKMSLMNSAKKYDKTGHLCQIFFLFFLVFTNQSAPKPWFARPVRRLSSFFGAGANSPKPGV
jgi:hypothetical protein